MVEIQYTSRFCSGKVLSSRELPDYAPIRAQELCNEAGDAESVTTHAAYGSALPIAGTSPALAAERIRAISI